VAKQVGEEKKLDKLEKSLSNSLMDNNALLNENDTSLLLDESSPLKQETRPMVSVRNLSLFDNPEAIDDCNGGLSLSTGGINQQ